MAALEPLEPRYALGTVQRRVVLFHFWVRIRRNRDWESIERKRPALQRFIERYWSKRNGQTGRIEIPREIEDLGNERRMRVDVPVLIDAPTIAQEHIRPGVLYACALRDVATAVAPEGRVDGVVDSAEEPPAVAEAPAVDP